MKNIVILGAGTGGTLVANLLSHKLDLKKWTITIIDKADEHHYQPGYLFIPFKLYGYEERSDIARPITDPLPRNAKFVKAEIQRIDHENKQVETSEGAFEYDYVISSLGCHLAPDEIEGLEETLDKNGVHTFYDLDSALVMQDALANMESGRLVIDISDLPIKCPVAPIEFAFLADYYFHEKGNRDRIDVFLVTPFAGAFTKPNANRVLSRIAEDKQIIIVPDFSLESVDAENKVINSYEGNTVEFDLLCIIPPNLGPDALENSGLGDGTGYGLTDPKTLKSRKADNFYLLGDNSNVATSKAGSVAHFEAETVVENILREIDGEKPLPSFDGHANCYIESGFNKALLIDFNYDVEPMEGKFPTPVIGPFDLLKETHINHMGKIAFDWIYWNMLLPGYMPMVPLLPSQMNFVGKDMSTHPKIQRSQAIKIKDIMTTDVTTVKEGTSLIQAAGIMAEKNVSSLPVVDVDGRLSGIITEADFLAAMNIQEDSVITQMLNTVIRRGRPRKTRSTMVESLMTKNPITIKENEPLQTAIQMMDKNKIKRLIIADRENKVKGIISRPDLVRLLSGR